MSIYISHAIEIELNGQPRLLAAGTTVAALLAELGVNTRGVAVEINGELAPRVHHEQRQIAAGDRVEIVTLVGGG